MELITQTPKQSLNKAFLKQRPVRSEIETFKNNLKILLSKVQAKESEENKKNHVRDFLLDTYYKGIYEVNTKDRKDLVIHLDKTNESNVGVIVEAKSPDNKAEMLKIDKANTKALQELVLYYFDERQAKGNVELKNLVVTNAYEWFIFDANVFDKKIYRNTQIRKLYETKVNDKKDNPFFYEELRKIFDNLDEELVCTYFNLKEYETILNNADLEDDKELIALFKIVSPTHLLKLAFADDSNSLNKPFYDELLHIIGLEEVKIKSKSIIRRKEEGNRNAASLLENAITILKTKDSLRRVKNISDYGAASEDRYFNVALELCIVWINRILFLKLLESQLVNYHKGNREYKFLNIKTIPDFDELFTLFHQVLAKTFADREDNIREKYKRVPYLNSSLFDIQEGTLEDLTITIESLKDTAHLPFINSTILKQQKAENQSFGTLEYLFKFLDAYDFASEGAEDVQEDNRSLINASVLGKVFEKINGYKDGSIFTPGFITMYMCRQAIRLAVVQKFKDTYGWNISEFADIKNYLLDYRSADKTKEFNALVNSLHLCDPAVGSGHFLVSSLNEIIAIKSKLGLLADESGVRLSEYQIVIENDELIITDENGDIFEYQINENGKPTAKAQRLQKTLFHEKQTLIENCLFGVDINPNSVKICRLRLWIELLKNAYYKENDNFAELETLPNIDINIKEGNSLLSRFTLQEKFRNPSIKKWIKEYSLFIDEYKNSKNKQRKDELKLLIKNFHKAFSGLLEDETSKLKEKLIKAQRRFDETQSPLIQGWNEVEREIASRKIQKEIDEIEKQIAEVDSKYNNAFEWRFEFPEVLDNDGNFIGFDIVIGNPPYFGISTMEKDLQSALAKSNYQTFSKGSDIYCLFYEKGFEILKENAPINFITSNRFCFTNYGIDLRQYLSDRNILQIINFNDIDVFENANVGSLIMLLTKSQRDDSQLSSLDYKKHFVLKPFNDVVYEKSKILNKEFFAEKQWSFDDNENQRIKAKIESKGISFINWKDISINRGITTGLNNVFIISEAEREKIILQDPISEEIIKPVLKGANIKRFSILPAKEYLIYTYTNVDIQKYKGVFDYLNNHRKELEEVWEAKHGQKKWYELRKCSYYDKFFEPKLVWTRLSNQNAFAISENGEFTVDSSSFAVSKDIKYLSAILNSKVVFFYFKLGSVIWGKDGIKWFGSYFDNIPIPKIEEKDQQPFVALVDQILELKKAGKDTQALENEIDALVYRLYDLTADEIAIVKGT